MYDYILYYHIGLIVAIIVAAVTTPIAVKCEDENNAYCNWDWPWERYLWSTGELFFATISIFSIMYIVFAPLVWIAMILSYLGF